MTYHNSLRRFTTTRRSDLWQLGVASFHTNVSSLYLGTYNDPFRYALESKRCDKEGFSSLIIEKVVAFSYLC